MGRTGVAVMIAGTLLLGIAGGCVDIAPFTCVSDAECAEGTAEGVCEVTGYCSFADEACATGRRYGAGAPSDMADTCVPDAPFVLPTQLALGSDHTCVRDDVGDVWCWGRNDRGQLGDGSRGNRTSPTRVRGLSDVVAVAAGEFHTCAVDSAGAVWCWGDNESGQLGDTESEWRSTPQLVDAVVGAVAVRSGEYHACALLADATVVCWGDNSRGQLGRGDVGAPQGPLPIAGLSAVTSLTLDGAHGCARTKDATLCWGKNAHGQFGLGHAEDQSRPVAVPWLGDARSVSAGGEHVCAVGADRLVRCAGRNEFGELGSGPVGDSEGDDSGDAREPRVVVGLGPVAGVSAGEWFTCATDAAGDVRCWGRGGRGELGDGAGADRQTAGDAVALTGEVSAVDTGERHACAIDVDGALWCWGSNEFGQLGDGGRKHGLRPVRAALGGPPVN